MVKIGTLVQILSPEYAAGRQGYVQGRELSGRWLVRLEAEFSAEDEPLLLSLEESDFEVINPELEEG